jgi:hypothetical protein
MAANDLLNFNEVAEYGHKEVQVRSRCKFAEVQSGNNHDQGYFQVKISGSVWPQSTEFRARFSSSVLTSYEADLP